MAQLQSLSIKGVDIIDYVFPVGIYISFSTDFDPNVHFEGTTWERIYDAFLYSVPQGQTSNVTGGEAEHTLTVDEMPSHNQKIAVADTASGNISAPNMIRYSNSSTAYLGELETKSAGGGQPHNNMPPYQGCYTWHRTA